MRFEELFEELLAMSLINVEECRKNKEKRDYLKELIIDFYEKINEGQAMDKKTMAYYDMWPVRELDRLKFKIIKDTSLTTEQKMILYNNLSQDKIKSESQFRRIMIQKEKNN